MSQFIVLSISCSNAIIKFTIKTIRLIQWFHCLIFINNQQGLWTAISNPKRVEYVLNRILPGTDFVSRRNDNDFIIVCIL